MLADADETASATSDEPDEDESEPAPDNMTPLEFTVATEEDDSDTAVEDATGETSEAADDAYYLTQVDHISVGPVWETPTKHGRPAVGLELVTHAARHAKLPFFAIGGIDPGNVAEVLAAGARRICVVRAIRDAGDPAAVAATLRRSFAAVGAEVLPGG